MLAVTGLESGDVGNLPGDSSLSYVAHEDTGNSVSGLTVVNLPVLFAKELTVKGENNAGNVAVSLGDRIYKDGNDFNRDSTDGTMVGVALGTVASGGEEDILVGFVQPGE